MYAHSTLITNDNVSIAIKYIESIHANIDSADVLVDKLRDDIVFGITTLSGKYYDISVRYQQQIIKTFRHYDDIEQLRTAIYEKWIFLTRE